MLSWYSLLKRNGESVDLGERKDVGSAGKSGGRGNCSQVVMYERKRKEKNYKGQGPIQTLQ